MYKKGFVVYLIAFLFFMNYAAAFGVRSEEAQEFKQIQELPQFVQYAVAAGEYSGIDRVCIQGIIAVFMDGYRIWTMIAEGGDGKKIVQELIGWGMKAASTYNTCTS